MRQVAAWLICLIFAESLAVSDTRVLRRARIVTAGETVPSIVNSANGGAAGACSNQTSCVVTLNVTSGNLLAVFVPYRMATGAATASVTDNCGDSGGASNTYTAHATASGSIYRIDSFTAPIGFTKSPCTITVAYGGTFTGLQTTPHAQQITGQHATTPVGTNEHKARYQGFGTAGTGTDVVTTQALTSSTTQTNTLITGICADQGGGGGLTPGTGYTQQATGGDGGNITFVSEYKTQATTGSPALTCSTSANSNFESVVIAVQHP